MSAAATLHVTNGDAALSKLARAGLGGEAIAWRDALQEGPVPALAPRELAAVRAEFIAAAGWAPRERAERGMRLRDETLSAALGARPVVLWFEHDLYDQLQLLQVLSFVDESLVDSELLALIIVDGFAGHEPFIGLGQLSGQDLASLWGSRRPLAADELARARRAWDAFTAADPSALAAEARGDGHAPAALRRLLEEYPAVRDGLARSERQLLRAIADGAADPVSAFLATQAMEQAPYAGDRQTWDRLAELAQGDRPLVEATGDVRAGRGALALTEAGERVLAGLADAVELRGIERSIGGVKLAGRAPAWRWDADRQLLVGR